MFCLVAMKRKGLHVIQWQLDGTCSSVCPLACLVLQLTQHKQWAFSHNTSNEHSVVWLPLYLVHWWHYSDLISLVKCFQAFYLFSHRAVWEIHNRKPEFEAMSHFCVQLSFAVLLGNFRSLAGYKAFKDWGSRVDAKSMVFAQVLRSIATISRPTFSQPMLWW